MFSTAEHIKAAPVNIIGIDSRAVELELTEPMTLSFGEFPSRPSGWLALTCEINGQNVVGYGEGATLPKAVFTDDCGENIANSMQELAIAAIQTEDGTLGGALEVVSTYCFADGKHYPTARLATEMALLDAGTKAHGMTMRDFANIPADITEVPYGKSIGGHDTSAILRQAEEALDSNARKIKIKISPSLFGDVMHAIATLQSEHPGLDIMVDANGGFDPQNQNHLDMLRALDEKGLIMIEEPVSRIGNVRGLQAVRMLRQALPTQSTPICLDDCLRTLDDGKTAIAENLAEIINIKPGRIGSFIKGLELVDFAAAQNAEVMVGGMLEGTPGRCMTTILGAFCLTRGFTVPGDLSLAQERLRTDLVPPEKQLKLGPQGGIVLPTGPGWGF